MTLPLSRLRAGLAGLCGLLLLTLAIELVAPVPDWRPPPPAPVAQSAPPPVLPDTVITPSRDAFALIDRRDVFDPKRAPLTPKAASGGGGTTSIGDLTLVGIILDGDTKLALLRVPGEPQAVALKAGASIQGWEVVAIGSDRVTLQGTDGQHVLVLNAGKSAPKAATDPDNL